MQLTDKSGMYSKQRVIYTLMILAAVAALTSCAVNPVTGKKQIMLMSEAQEIQLGFSYDPQVLATFGEYNDPALKSYVQGMGKEMGKVSHRPNLEYHVKVVDSPVMNAFAVPGGYIYFTRGILAHLNNEAEFMGVLGHEMGHITARHSVTQQTRQQLASLLLIGGMIASEKFASYAQYAMQGMELLFLSFSREHERQADDLGVEYATRMGYDATRMADFYKVLIRLNMAQSQAGVPTFLSTHPDPGDRYNAVLRQTRVWQDSLRLSSYKVNDDGYLKMIDGIVYGEDPKQGYTMDNNFYHPELRIRFAYPPGWELTNMPTQVTVQPPDGKALMLLTIAPQRTLEAAVDSTLALYGLQLQRSEKKSMNGLPVIITQSVQESQDQQTGQTATTRVLTYFIQHSSVIYAFHSIAMEADFASRVNTMEASMRTFSTLTDPARLNVKPKRVYVKKAPRAGTLASTLSYYNVPQAMMEELALLNNMELNDAVPAGKLIKIVSE